MMPLGAPSISKYGSLVRPDAQIVALRAQCARTALEAPPKLSMSVPKKCNYTAVSSPASPIVPMLGPVFTVSAPTMENPARG